MITLSRPIAVLAAGLLCFAVSAVSNAALPVKEKPLDLLGNLDAIRSDIKDLGKELKLQESPKGAQFFIDDMRRNYKELLEKKPSKGDPAAFKKQCEAQLGIVAGIEKSVKRGDWAGARKTLEELKGLNKGMYKEFTPGMLGRTGSRLKRM
jgi:hypothetical protein